MEKGKMTVKQLLKVINSPYNNPDREIIYKDEFGEHGLVITAVYADSVVLEKFEYED